MMHGQKNIKFSLKSHIIYMHKCTRYNYKLIDLGKTIYNRNLLHAMLDSVNP
jgi:hypothetical protein